MGQSLLKAALLVAAGLSGCVYYVGLGFASDCYYDNAYGYDPTAVMKHIITATIGRRSATSGLAAVGTTITIIPATASFCSTPYTNLQ